MKNGQVRTTTTQFFINNQHVVWCPHGILNGVEMEVENMQMVYQLGWYIQAERLLSLSWQAGSNNSHLLPHLHLMQFKCFNSGEVLQLKLFVQYM